MVLNGEDERTEGVVGVCSKLDHEIIFTVEGVDGGDAREVREMSVDIGGAVWFDGDEEESVDHGESP